MRFREFFNLEGSLLKFILGTATLTVLVQLVYDWMKVKFGDEGAFVLVVILVLIVIGLVFRDYYLLRRARKMNVKEGKIDPRKGLILVVSPNNPAIALAAVEHHAKKLMHCWLIFTKESLQTAAGLVGKIQEACPSPVNVHFDDTYQVLPGDSQSTWWAVERIYDEAHLLGLAEIDVVADITGGTKPMTAGVTLACSSAMRDLQYVETRREPTRGQPVSGAEPISILITTGRKRPVDPE